MNILITGGTGGLGKSIIEAFAKDSENYIVFTFNKSIEEAQVIMKDKQNVLGIKCDFTNKVDLINLEAVIKEKEIDVLINNAYVGYPQEGHFHKINPNCFLESFMSNIVPTIQITQAAILGFKERKFGKIINILSSSLINKPPIGYSIYASNKAYILQLSKSWSVEYARYNITSNCISPDFMETELNRHMDERMIEQIRSRNPLKRILKPEEVVESIVFLLKGSQQINGANIVINAGDNIV